MRGLLLRRSTLFRIIAVVAICILFFPAPAQASPDCVCFTLRDRETHLISGVVNSYFPGMASVAAGSPQITVGPGSGAAVDIVLGDLLLVIQMQDAKINYTNTSAYGKGGTSTVGTGYIGAYGSGNYEFVVANNNVSFATGGLLKIEGYGSYGGLLNPYTNANATSTRGQRRFQVIHVPAYMNVRLSGTLTALPWNGSTGGVLTIDVVNSLNFNGHDIDVTGLGFRGGGGLSLAGAASLADTDFVTPSSFAANGSKGEGIAGTPKWVFTSNVVSDTLPPAGTDAYPGGSYARGGPATAGGGGTDGNPTLNDMNSGGGGGSNGGAGGKGGNTYSTNLDCGGRGGAAFAEGSAGRVVLGGGGGAGSSNDGTGIPGNGWASSGAPGGGIVIIRTGHFTGVGAVKADGASALTTLNDGAGGGGGGGSVVLLAKDNPLTGLTVSAKGGKGGDAWPQDAGGDADRHGPGGGGGGGSVYLSGAATNLDVSGGQNGVTTISADSYGATPGAAGKSLTTMSQGNIPGARPGYMCYEPTAVRLATLSAHPAGCSKILLSFTALFLGTVFIALSGRRIKA
jgi:hypothetical protein